MTESVGSLLGGAIARSGDRVALRARGEVRTHRELLANASRLANALAGEGLVPGDHVALMVTDRVESVEAYLACFLGGFTAVHVNDRLASREVDAIVAGADARAFLYTEDVGAKVADVDVLDQIETVIGMGDHAGTGHLDWSRLLEDASASTPKVAREPDDLAIIGFTSGTTGRPKGVMHTQETMLRILRHMPVHFDLRPRSRCAFTGTLSFVSAIWGAVLPHLYLGGEVSFMAGIDPEEWIDRLIVERSDFTYVPTPLAPDFIDQVSKRPEVLDHLRVAFHSGSKMPRQVVERMVEVVGSRFGEAYGMTESGAPVTRTEDRDWDPSNTAHDVFASVGRAVHIADVAIVDAEGARLPPGEPGEIEVFSETQFVGYYKSPEVTESTLVGGRIRTGDIGWMDDAGYLYVTDRLKDMVVSGGMNVFPAEVEGALADLTGLSEIAVFGVPDERWGETVVAVAVVADQRLDEAAIIAACRERLASYKKPTRVVFVDRLPRTASLKVDKPELRQRWARGEFSRRDDERES